MIAVIDYGAGNLRSVEKAFGFLGCDTKVVTDAQELLSADGAVLPGVGAFGDSMDCLERSGLVGAIREFIGSGRPFLGICLGLQLLFEESEESLGRPGLGILKGKIRRIPAGDGLKIPHMGWNSLELRQSGGLYRDLPEHPYVYFVHSYYLHAEDPAIVSAQTQYGVTIDAAVRSGNLHAVQFHPEKSGRTGLKMLENFAAMVKAPSRV